MININANIYAIIKKNIELIYTYIYINQLKNRNVKEYNRRYQNVSNNFRFLFQNKNKKNSNFLFKN